MDFVSGGAAGGVRYATVFIYRAIGTQKRGHRESEHGKEHRKLWQRQHPSAQGRGARTPAPRRHLRLGRARRLRARRLRDPVQRRRRGAPGLRQPDHPHRLPRWLHPGRGQRPRLPARLEPLREALQLGARLLRALRRRQIQQQRRRRLRLLARHQRPGFLRDPVRVRVHGRHGLARRQQVLPPLQEGQGRGRQEEGARNRAHR